MQRYDIWMEGVTPEESENGDWVLYNDVEKLLKSPQAGSEAVSAEFALLGGEDIEKIKELIELQLTEATRCDLPYATAWLRRQKAAILSRVAVLEKIVSAAT